MQRENVAKNGNAYPARYFYNPYSISQQYVLCDVLVHQQGQKQNIQQ